MNSNDRIKEGLPYPMGAAWDGKGTNFAVFSANATRVEVCIFDPEGKREIERIALPEYTNQIWHGYISDVAPGTVYGLRVYGPYEPESGHRFNQNKLLLDPYACAHVGTLQWDPAVFGYKMESADDLTFDERDSAPFVPKCSVVNPNFDWTGARARGLAHWNDTVIYELHVEGFTKRHPAVAENLRGTYAGLGTKPVVDYISSLGVTSVELLPIHTFVDDDGLLKKGLKNYWGYNSIGFFAPDPRYASEKTDSLREFKEMVAQLHEGGLEVILDVVYNHTAEGNEFGPTLSFKGIDNASYYRLLSDDQRHYVNDTGTGNTLNVSHPRVLQMVMDSLRYWVQLANINGFRFDLGTILAREPNGFDNRSGFLKACCQDPLLRTVKMIAEPWDCGPGGYQVGAFPPGWAEWNDKFRDTVRDFWRGEAQVGEMTTRLCASGDVFNHQGRRPWSSINFVTAHDGFTLNDVFSYNEKHNEANGEENRDGATNNRSWNCGAEGPSDDPEVYKLRERQIRNALATLMLAQGTPMLVAGDEFGRTQHGNNNAYCQDNEISWVDWDIKEKGQCLLTFAKKVIGLRRTYPILRRDRFLTGEYTEDLGVKDLTWISVDGKEMEDNQWGDASINCFGMMLDGRAQPSGIRQMGREATLLCLFNINASSVDFSLPEPVGGNCWALLLDTTEPCKMMEKKLKSGEQYGLTARSLALFKLDQAE